MRFERVRGAVNTAQLVTLRGGDPRDPADQSDDRQVMQHCHESDCRHRQGDPPLNIADVLDERQAIGQPEVVAPTPFAELRAVGLDFHARESSGRQDRLGHAAAADLHQNSCATSYFRKALAGGNRCRRTLAMYWSPLDISLPVLSWHSEGMAGKDIERIRAKSALEVIRQHPVLVLFAVSPVLALLAATWWLIGASWAISGAVVLLLASAGFIVFRG